MLPDQPFYLPVKELPLSVTVSTQFPDFDSGIAKLPTEVHPSPSQMVLLCFDLKSDTSALNGHTASVSVNGIAYHGLPVTMVNITELLSSSGEYMLTVWVGTLPDHARVHVYVVVKVTEKELRRWTGDSSPYVHTRADFVVLARALAVEEGYALGHHFQVSLLCPLTRSRMRIPGRGVGCRHLQCFDVFSYLGSNESTLQPSWVCPVCSGQVLVQDICVDLVLLDFLRSAPEEASLMYFPAYGQAVQR